MKFFSTVAIVATAFFSADAHAVNLIVNGGFEDGVYSSALGGNTNPNVPVGWTSSVGFDLHPTFNFVTTSPTPNTTPFAGCVYRESKSERIDDEVRPVWRANL